MVYRHPMRAASLLGVLVLCTCTRRGNSGGIAGSGGRSPGCCEDLCEAKRSPTLVQCANASAPPWSAPESGSQSERSLPQTHAVPLLLIMQLATPNLWCSFCRYTAAVNAAWARQRGHRYFITSGEYLSQADVWRGGNVRAVRQVLDSVPDVVQWIFHLDCDAMIVDHSSRDAVSDVVASFASSETEILLSRDESGFAGGSRLTNLGTGLWRRSAWTLRFLDRAWRELVADKVLTEQEVIERLLQRNEQDCVRHVAFLPAGLLNSESSNPIAAPPWRQPVVHLAGIPDVVRATVFQIVWKELCAGSMDGHAGLHQGSIFHDLSLRKLFLHELSVHVTSLPDIPAGNNWIQVSAPARLARRLALSLHHGGRNREEAAEFFDLAIRRIASLESRADGLGAAAAAHLALLRESLAGPLLELGRTQEAAEILLRPRPEAAGPRHHVDELLHAENLCAVLQASGRLGEAEAAARRALAGLEAAFPASARDVRPAHARARLAQVLQLRGRWREAEPLMRGALRGLEASLGAEHPQALGAARNLAVLLKQRPQGARREALPEAEALLRRAARGLAAALGADHPEAERASRNLANFVRWRDRQHRPAAPQQARAGAEL